LAKLAAMQSSFSLIQAELGEHNRISCGGEDALAAAAGRLNREEIHLIQKWKL
jgi:hypothetical protein